MRLSFSLSLLWFFCLGGLGVFFPFYSLYLRENAGLEGTQIGVVLAVLPLVGIAMQPFWGQVADRSGSRTRVVALLALGASVGYLGLGFARGFPAFLLGTALLACFSSALIPGCVAVTLASAGNGDPRAFGRIRVWGTVGFLLLVVGFPPTLDAWQAARGLSPEPGGPSEPGLSAMFPVTAAFVLLGSLVAMSLPREGAVAQRAARGDWRQLLRNRAFVRLLLFCLTAYVFLQGPMTLFPIFVREAGGSLDSVSRMWVLMLVLEIPLVAFSGASLARIGARGLLFAGVLAGGLRWATCGLTGDLAWIHASSLLHGVVVAGLLVGAPLYVEAVVPEQLRSTAQGLLAMLGVGLGGIVSNTASGWLLEHAGARVPYALGGAGALALACLLPLLLPAPTPAGQVR